MSNIESLLVHTMPLVRCVEKGTTPLLSSKKTDDDSEEEESKKKKKKDFELRDVWSAFHETSAFG